MSEDSNGEETLGMTASDRITSYSELMKKDNLSRRNPLHHHIGWPSLLAMTVSAINLVAITMTIYRYKVKNSLTWKPCIEGKDTNTGDADTGPSYTHEWDLRVPL